MYPESLSTLKLTLSWICLIKRNEIKSHIELSTGNWIGDAFRLHRMEIIDWSDRRSTKMLGHAMVAGLDYVIPKAPLLSTAFPIAHQLAGVHAPIHVDKGLIYHG